MFKSFFATLNSYRRTAFSLENIIPTNTIDNKWRPIVLFSLTVLFYVLYQLAVQPGWILGGEMWAEMATNYFPNANSASYLTKFFSTDAGYIPVPQRLIAYLGNLFAFPASSIPYFYTWSSIVLTAMLVGVFCLSAFRNVIKNDFLRFVTAISILIVADFETRTFINFTYFVAFFAAVITALALVEDSEDVPIWSWFLPILMVSKPAVLSALPLMIVASLVSQPRFRWIVITTIILCVGQLTQMILSQNAGIMPLQSHDITLVAKIIASIGYFFGLLGGYLIGPAFLINKYLLILFGILSLCVITFILLKVRRKPNALVVVGISLLFFNILLNCFALSSDWNIDMLKLSTLPLYRHIITGFFGCILIISGVIANLTETKKLIIRYPIAYSTTGATIFIIWFVLSGWLSFGVNISKEPSSPVLNSSQWQNLAIAIDSSEPVVCVPIDPFSWVYGRNCSLLNPEMNSGQEYRRAEKIDDNFIVEIVPPSWVKQRTLISFGILIKPMSTQITRVSAKAIVTSTDGTQQELRGERVLPISGGMLLLNGQTSTRIKNATSVKFIFNVPVEIRFITNSTNPTPAILWMGN